MRRVVVITGASAGVGRATALQFARSGFDVALLARGHARLESAARDARGLRAAALPIAVDVAEAQAVDAAAQQVESEFGPIDIWINNAMVTICGPSQRMKEAASD